MILNFLHVLERPFAIHKINGQSRPAKPSSTAYPVEISLAVWLTVHVKWDVIVDDKCDLFNINASSTEVGGDEKLLFTFTEPVQLGNRL